MKTLIVGLGNPILGDDGVGWRVSEEVKARLYPEHQEDIQIECASLGGLSLMERLVGCQRAILIDSMHTGRFPDGHVSVFPLHALPDPLAGHTASTHDTSLQTAIKAGIQMGMDLPETITVVAIEATTVHEFSEELTPVVAAALPAAVQMVLDLL